MEKQTFADHWLLLPEDRQITRTLIDAALTLQMVGTRSTTEICIEVPFSVQTHGSLYRCTVEDPGSLVPVLDLFLKEVTQIKVSHVGTLQVHIMPNIMICVEAHSDYEAWNIASTDWGGVTCMPGGSVAFWHNQNDATMKEIIDR